MTSTDSPGAHNSISGLLHKLGQDSRAQGLPAAPTGFTPLDTVLDGGFLPQELVLLGGRPGVGKTLTALQWARATAGAGRTSAVVCYEHDEVTLLARLLMQEVATLHPELDSTTLLKIRAQVRQFIVRVVTIRDLAAFHPAIDDALTSLDSTAGHLNLFRASTQWSDTSWIAELTVQNVKPGGVLVVDYLQKVPVEGVPNVREQVMRATEALKDLAVSADITVLALAAADEKGVAARRLRLDHLRGSDSLAHECDIALVLNEKVDATADRHLRYDSLKMERAKQQVVLSVEKNRRGEHDVHMQFDKDFANYRLRPEGSFNPDGLYDVDHPSEGMA